MAISGPTSPWVTSRVRGYFAEVVVKANTRVRADDVLIPPDDSDHRVALETAKSLVATAGSTHRRPAGGGAARCRRIAAFTILPAATRNIVSPLIGLWTTLAPTVEPTIGGYLSQTFFWHWPFPVNIAPGISVAAGAVLLIDFARPNWQLSDLFGWVLAQAQRSSAASNTCWRRCHLHD